MKQPNQCTMTSLFLVGFLSMAFAQRGLSGEPSGGAGSPPLDLDRYGGWKKTRFESTGFFHVKYDGKRWWFVTPEGNAFLSFGVNHYHAGWFCSSHNREHWEEAFGGRATSKPWTDGLKKRISDDFDRLGFNTLGIHTDETFYGVKPYIADYEPVRFSHYFEDLSPESYVDVFAPSFAAHCERLAKRVAGPRAKDPMLIGYQMADCPVLTDRERQQLGKGYTWPLRLRNLGTEAPGKKAYVDMMRTRYNTIKEFNKAYGTDFPNWPALAAAKNWRLKVDATNKSELKDNEAFNLVCVDKYYCVAKRELRKVDPNHLFFGDKINGNTEQLLSIVHVTAKYTDVVFYQMFGLWEQQEKVIEGVAGLVDLPLLNGDSSIAGPPNANQPNPCGPTASTRSKQAALCEQNARGAFSHPHFVGWHRCGIIDTWTTTPGKKQMQHQGVYSAHGHDYPLGRVLKELSAQIYEIHMSAKRP